VAEKGYGKRSKIDDYRITNRGGKGVKTLNITEKTGELVAIKSVSDDNDLMIITQKGITIRLAVNTISVLGRATQGVRVINLREDDRIASVARIAVEEAATEDVTDDNVEDIDNEDNNLEQE
jgi:DNA gyrase subunit A